MSSDSSMTTKFASLLWRTRTNVKINDLWMYCRPELAFKLSDLCSRLICSHMQTEYRAN